MKSKKAPQAHPTLNAYLSQGGVASRRKAAEMIAQGQITVNGEPIRMPSYRVKPGDEVRYGQRKIAGQDHRYFLMNKPRDYVTTREDEQGRRTVVSLLGKGVRERVYPVGRLDRDTTGLLILTNDGAFAHRLMHPRYGVKKTYNVALDKPLQAIDLERIRKGVRLIDGLVKVERIVPRAGSRSRQVVLTLSSGRNRVIRRLFDQLGYKVRGLDRVQYATLTTRELRVGTWRILTKDEIAELRTASSVAPRAKADRSRCN